jgi:hypothetical protein
VPGALELLAGGALPEGWDCATTQLAQSKRTKRNPNFRIDMGGPPSVVILDRIADAFFRTKSSLIGEVTGRYPADAVDAAAPECTPADVRYLRYCVGCGPFSRVSRSQIQPSRV